MDLGGDVAAVTARAAVTSEEGTMTTYDLLDEATIEADPDEVVRALLDEAAGRSNWWQPFVRMRQRGDKPPTEIGAVIDFTVNGDGPLGGRWSTARFSGRVTTYEPERRLVMTYFDGDFRGTAEWTLQPVDATHTRIAARWMTDPYGGMRLWARFADVPGSQSKVMQEGFRAIERFTAGKRTESAT
jgi:uncharacterized protein YndB with AHSA1/START domain